MPSKIRNKVITIRINEELLNNVKKILDNANSIYLKWPSRNIYYNKIYSNYNKATIADIIENELISFVEDYKQYL